MVKKRIFFCFSFICTLFVIQNGLLNATSVTIDFSDLEKVDNGKGHLLPTAYLGENFSFKVVVSQGSRNTSDVTIEGTDALTIFGKNQEMSFISINGKPSSHITYLYTAVANKEGVYTIGPAYVTDGGNKIQSPTVHIQVIQSSRERQARKEQAERAAGIKNPKVLVDLKVNKERCVVGEQLEVIVHVSYTGPVINWGIVQDLQFKGFLTRDIEQLQTGTEEIDGIPYKFTEKKYIISPLQPGEKSIGPAQIVYIYRKQKKKNRHGGFFAEAFFGDVLDMHLTKKAVVASKTQQIHVDPLPPFRGKVDGVGEFISLTASFDKQEVTQNEPVILKISLAGKANLDQITDLSLVVPEGVKWYKSKAATIQLSDFAGIKEFEYIVQIPQIGTIEIPPQKFTFFDTVEQKYKTLQSQPLAIVIKPAPEQIMPSQSKQITKNESIEKNTEDKKPKRAEIDIHFIEEDTFAHKKQAPSLPFWLFISIILIPLLFTQRHRLQSITAISFFKKRLHKKFIDQYDRQLTSLVEHEDASQLYHFFIHFFATKYTTPIADVTEQFITQKLSLIGLESEKIDDFLIYLNECASLYFAPTLIGPEYHTKLVKRAKYWYLIINK